MLLSMLLVSMLRCNLFQLIQRAPLGSVIPLPACSKQQTCIKVGPHSYTTKLCNSTQLYSFRGKHEKKYTIFILLVAPSPCLSIKICLNHCLISFLCPCNKRSQVTSSSELNSRYIYNVKSMFDIHFFLDNTFQHHSCVFLVFLISM